MSWLRDAPMVSPLLAATAAAAGCAPDDPTSKEGQQLGLLPGSAAPRRGWALGPSNCKLPETTKSRGPNSRPRAPPTRAWSWDRSTPYQLVVRDL